MSFERFSAITLGENRGKPRVYVQGKWLLEAGFQPGMLIDAYFGNGVVVVELSSAGARTVSSKKNGTVSVIDINTSDLSVSLRGATTLTLKAKNGRLIITPSRTAQKRLTRVRNGLEGSLFSGGGLLSEAARQAGFTPSFAVEWDERYASIFEKNHPTARMFNMSVHEVPLEELHQVELLTIGIPCEPFSIKRRDVGARGVVPEAHDLGDMVVWALRVIDAVNPYTVVIEEVPAFLESGAGWILRHALSRMGYTVEARVLDPAEHGEITGRRRAVIVATSDTSIVWPQPKACSSKLATVLESGEQVWFDEVSKPWLFKHWKEQEARGNNFMSQVLDAETLRVGCISKRYFAQQGDGAVVRHPSEPGKYRWLTLNEVRRLQGLPESYFLGESKTTAGEVLGQGVHVGMFRQVIEGVR